MDFIFTYLILVTSLGCALMSGLFFIFSNTVMHALSNLPPSEGISAMQWINRVIQNVLFLGVFSGTGLGSLCLLISLIWRWGQTDSIYILSGSLLYLVGVLFITIRVNVPMNNTLDSLDPEDRKASEYWEVYLKRWTRWNHVRAVTSLLSTAAFILALR